MLVSDMSLQLRLPMTVWTLEHRVNQNQSKDIKYFKEWDYGLKIYKLLQVAQKYNQCDPQFYHFVH